MHNIINIIKTLLQHIASKQSSKQHPTRFIQLPSSIHRQFYRWGTSRETAVFIFSEVRLSTAPDQKIKMRIFLNVSQCFFTNWYTCDRPSSESEYVWSPLNYFGLPNSSRMTRFLETLASFKRQARNPTLKHNRVLCQHVCRRIESFDRFLPSLRKSTFSPSIVYREISVKAPPRTKY